MRHLLSVPHLLCPSLAVGTCIRFYFYQTCAHHHTVSIGIGAGVIVFTGNQSQPRLIFMFEGRTISRRDDVILLYFIDVLLTREMDNDLVAPFQGGQIDEWTGKPFDM